MQKPIGRDLIQRLGRYSLSRIFSSYDDDAAVTSLKYLHYGSDDNIRKVSSVVVRSAPENLKFEAKQAAVLQSSYSELDDKTADYESVSNPIGVKFVAEKCNQSGHEPKSTDIGNIRKDGNKLFRFLIADDSILSRSMLIRLLRLNYCTCDEAEDGLKAIEMVKVSMESGKPYDIILMDSEMPNMNGPETARHIKTQLGYTGLVIGVTGNALPEDISIFKSHGADDVLVKPIKIKQFDEILNGLFSNQMLRT